MKTPPAVTDLETLPVILTIKDISGVYRIHPSTIRRGIQDGTFHPRPKGRNPYRWTRADVQADLQRPADEHVTLRPHGVAVRGRKRR